MPRLIHGPTRIAAAGEPPKLIEEYIGRANSATAIVSIAKMTSPAGWSEPGQTPEFAEYTLVLRGVLRVESSDEGGVRETGQRTEKSTSGVIEVAAGQAVITEPGEWVRYSTPGPEGAEYIAICLPAFSPATVHRDAAD